MNAQLDHQDFTRAAALCQTLLGSAEFHYLYLTYRYSGRDFRPRT